MKSTLEGSVLSNENLEELKVVSTAVTAENVIPVNCIRPPSCAKQNWYYLKKPKVLHVGANTYVIANIFFPST